MLDDPGEEQEQEQEVDNNFRGYFNIAVESLLDKLFPIIVLDAMALYELGAFVEGEDVWVDGMDDPHPAYVGN